MRSSKRIVATALVAALFISLLSGLSFAVQGATVDYVYSGSYIKNWGTRGTAATFLSPKAEEFYEDNNTSYEILSALSGSSSESSVPSSALYKELQDLMESNHDYITSYDGTKDLFQYTDCQNSGKTSSKISSFYSGAEIGPSWNGGWNREHTWPNSKGDKAGSGENDLMMLRPTATSENSSRGNKAYGQSSGYYNPNSESDGKYDLRGDTARIILYVYVRWECTNTGSKYNPNGIFGTDGVFESKQVLLDWMEQDPVDTWELGRNDSVESITGTRNVFVDYPELAFLLYNEEVPADMTTPSGEAANSGSNYTITAQSSNSDHGTVSLSGRTINATPASGYTVVGYTLLSGNAQVTRSGNSFTVAAESDCTVQIDFAAREQAAVSFSQSGEVVSQQVAYIGDSITLPQHQGESPEGMTFMGWVEENVNNAAVKPARILAAGDSYTVKETGILRALYATQGEGNGTASNVFAPYSGELTEGDYLVTYDDGAMKAENFNGRIGYTQITETDGTVLSPAEDLIWTISQTEDGYWTIYNTAAGVYASGTGTKNKAEVQASLTDYAKWTATGTETYVFLNLGNSTKDVNAQLRRNTTYGFACYASNSNVGGPVSLYKRAASSVIYSTNDSAGVEIEGDFNGNGVVTDRDALYLLRHTLFASQYPITLDGDVNGDGAVADSDALYLLRHILFGSKYYPLYPNKN